MKAVLILAGIVFLAPIAPAQTPAPVDDPIVVSTEHPRLFLRPARLRRLRRERERTSIRWEQFQALIAGRAPMAEPGFANALYYQISGDKDIGRSAVAWAMNSNDLRQITLIYDWCQDLFIGAEKATLAARIEKGMMSPAAAGDSVAAAHLRALAAVALFDEVPNSPGRELERLVHTWWAGKIVPALKAGQHIVARDDAYDMWEIFHAVEDNTNIDLRESAPRFFKEFPIEHLLSYYPLPFPGPENEYFIGATAKILEPDLRLSALGRAAELAMVAYDVNAPETQVLQGWLMHDKYLLRGTFGLPYELLWANPYQPGLSYYHVPLIYYAPEYGRLFIRASWEEETEWFGAFDGVLQKFDQNGPALVDARKNPKPLSMKEATICFGPSGMKFQLNLEEPQTVFVVGLAPARTYQVEVDDEEIFEKEADRGGILELDYVPAGRPIGIRMK